MPMLQQGTCAFIASNRCARLSLVRGTDPAPATFSSEDETPAPYSSSQRLLESVMRPEREHVLAVR
eukprot:354256-Chlamydomonas_euryale.AAC.3